jgi:hypothetical protein
MFVKVINDFVKIAPVIVNYSPSKAPARESVDFRNGTSADNRDFLLKVSHGIEFCLVFIDQAIVNFVCDNGDLEFIGYFEDLHLMLFRETRATGVRWVVN